MVAQLLIEFLNVLYDSIYINIYKTKSTQACAYKISLSRNMTNTRSSTAVI